MNGLNMKIIETLFHRIDEQIDDAYIVIHIYNYIHSLATKQATKFLAYTIF